MADAVHRPTIRITARSPLDGLDLEVDADALLDDAMTTLLARLADETTAAAEDVHRFRFGRAADRCRCIASVLERSQPRLDEWLEARTRRLAEMLNELEVTE